MTKSVRGRIIVFTVIVGATGVLSAVVWWLITPLPSFVLRKDLTAEMSERGYSEMLSADARFSVLGLVVGLGLGALAWAWFRRWGWPVVLVAVSASVAAGLGCLGIGLMLDAGSFDDRMASAIAGSDVRIALELHTPVPLAMWVVAAVIPTLLAASLGPEVTSGDLVVSEDNVDSENATTP